MRLALLALPFSLLGLLSAAPDADAAPKKKYSFALVKVAQPRIEGQIKAGFAGNARLVMLDATAPDPATKKDAFKAHLTKKGITGGAFKVTVEITEASEEVEPMPDKPNSQRLVVRVGLHMLGEKNPENTMGFAGDGNSTIKIEVGKKIRDRDREYAWDEVAKDAVAKAIEKSLVQLDAPPKKK